MSGEHAAPVEKKFWTRGVAVLAAIAGLGVLMAIYRFIFGLGAATNLSDQYPWGIWIGLDVATGVALAAGGFTTAALVYIFHREEYHGLVRPALLTATLGYTFVVLGLLMDLGRPYNIWHPLWPTMWQGNSVLFEVAICVVFYLHVLYFEFIPIVCERFKGRVNLPGPLGALNRPVDGLLHIADKVLGKLMFFFIIAGVVLSCMHQSSLGGLMVIALEKVHPLWSTPIMPMLFLLSAFMVGFPMVVFEGFLASRSFGLPFEGTILARMSRYTVFLSGLYFMAKMADLAVRGALPYLFEGSFASNMFLIELFVGVLAPFLMLQSPKLRNNPKWLFTAASMIVGGVALNRVNVFLVAYHPPYAEQAYFPSVPEILVTAGLVATLVLVYRFLVIWLPVLPAAHGHEAGCSES